MKAINSIHNATTALITVLCLALLGMVAAGRVAAVETQGQAVRLSETLPVEDAVRILGRFCPDTLPAVLREAVEAYGGDPNAVNLLGRLLQNRYNGDANCWRQVNPQTGTKLEGLLTAALEVHSNDRELLDTIAVSLCPAPLEMLEVFTEIEQESLRDRLATLDDWQLVEFDGGQTADQPAFVRRYLNGRMEKQRKHDLLIRIAAWWEEKAKRETPANPQDINELRPLLWAVEHLLEADEVDMATDIFMVKQSRDSLYTPEYWLRRFGYLDENIRLNSRVIALYERLVYQKDRQELRNDLAACYYNRGIALSDQRGSVFAIADYNKAIAIYEELIKEGRGKLRNDLADAYNILGSSLRDHGVPVAAIDDYGRAIAIFQELVEAEGRRELRNDLADTYNNRGNALGDQGDLTAAIDDYAKAIAIYEELVGKECRRELRNDLAAAYNNRGLVLGYQGDLKGAIADFDKAIAIYKKLMETESRRELSNDLANCYNNRGVAQKNQGDPASAIADCNRAIAIYEELVEKEGRRDLGVDLAYAYNDRGNALSDKGDPASAIDDYSKAIAIYLELVETEGQRELRNDLAGAYYNRSITRREQGDLSGAIEDCDKATAIFEELVKTEGRLELRDYLADTYNNRGNALGDQGDLASAIDDYGKAIAICEQLVEAEGRRELRNDLAMALLNRAMGYGDQGEWKKAQDDAVRGIKMWRELIWEGGGQLLPNYLKSLGWRCEYLKEMGGAEETTKWVNEALGWLSDAQQAETMNEMLQKKAFEFLIIVGLYRTTLSEAGMDEALFNRVQLRMIRRQTKK